jgi:hypothetical protein
VDAGGWLVADACVGVLDKGMEIEQTEIFFIFPFVN